MPTTIRTIAEIELGYRIGVGVCLYRDGYQVLPKTVGFRMSAPYLGEADRWAKIFAATTMNEPAT